MKSRPCDGSGVRVMLTAREARQKLTHCPTCDREVKVRPPKGEQEATIPSHVEKKS